MTEPERPVVRPPDIWGGGPGGDAVGGVPGRQVDPAGDPDRYVPGRQVDPALDPDRFDPDRVDADRADLGRVDPDAAPPLALPLAPPLAPPPRLDPRRDPDRFGADRTLTEMLGEGAHEEPRDSYVWLLGLLSMLVFLGLIALVTRSLGP